MKSVLFRALPVLAISLGFCHSTQAWGRHDLITELTVSSPEFSHLRSIRIQPETIEQAAPDLMKRVIPGLLKWCERYHREHDPRYAWTPPQSRAKLAPAKALLWALEDNVDTPLSIGSESTAAEILVRYTLEPDGMMDEGLESSPYIERLRPSMSYFATNDTHTHAFRHYYVPSSLIPPILEPKGIAPYRADLYAHLARGAFATGHPYWGYRFLAWSLHYIQDVTQPWHTVFVPGVSFLKFSKTAMKQEISALHYLTEAFGDSWILHRMMRGNPFAEPTRALARVSDRMLIVSNPWYIAELTEDLAKNSHDKASEIAGLARDFFKPVVDRLGEDLKLHVPSIELGGTRLISAHLDFSGNGEGATRFLAPLWSSSFSQIQARDRFAARVSAQLDAAVAGSQELLRYTLGTPAGLAIKGSSKG